VLLRACSHVLARVLNISEMKQYLPVA